MSEREEEDIVTTEQYLKAVGDAIIQQADFNTKCRSLFEDVKELFKNHESRIQQLEQQVKLLIARQEDPLVNTKIRDGFH